MTAKPKRAAVYARVSTQDQNPDTQLLELRTYAKARGLQVVQEFVDKESGAKEERPQLDKLWEMVRGSEVDSVLVWKFDRFARSTKQLVDALAEFQHLGVDFISQTEQIDTSSPTGKAMFTMISAIAEFERSLISERIKAGLVRAKAQGKRIGQRPRPDSEKKQIMALRKQGLSYNAISKQTGIPRGTVSRYVWQQMQKTKKKQKN